MTVAQGLGKSDSEMPDGVYRIGLPRTDLNNSYLRSLIVVGATAMIRAVTIDDDQDQL